MLLLPPSLKAPAFVKASSFAKATADKMADKMAGQDIWNDAGFTFVRRFFTIENV